MNKKIFTVSIMVLVSFAVGIIASRAGGEDASKAKSNIAVVSIPRIMAESKYAESMQKDVMAQKETSLGELEKLKAQMDAVKADMDTRKRDSEDYLKLKHDLLQQKAVAESQKEFLQEELMLMNKQAMERLYAQIIESVKQIAEARGVELVLDMDEVQLPSPSVSELTMMIQTHKVLYSASYLDITEEVIKVIDSNNK